jgi:MFS family permease
MKKSKLIFIAGIGSLFEVFDFYLFSLFAVALNYSFFGKVNQHSVLWIFLIFAVGYLARIVGALIFGYWGDKLGRLYSFKKTIVIMALSSILIGFLPTYESVGILAVILLIALRFIQGISYGGEYSGAIIVVSERYKKHTPLLVLCITLLGTVGIFLAQLTYLLLSHFLDHQSMMNYGWRVAYIFGGILILHSYQARKKIAESEEFKFSIHNKIYKNTIGQMITSYKGILLLGILSLVGVQFFWGVFMIYLPNYISLKYPSLGITSNTYNTVILGSIIGQIIGAFLADKTSIRKVYSIATMISILLIIPLTISMASNLNSGIESFYILLFIISVANGSTTVLYMLQLSKRFPVKYRYTLVATAFAISAFFFIGLPPFLFSYFTREASMYYPMLVFGIGCIIQFIAVQFFYKKTEDFQDDFNLIRNT